jgi:XapX domain-containing protein
MLPTELDMKPYLLSLGAGLLVGIVYSLLNVRSPAPPVIALVGLLGILLGEQLVPLAKRVMGPEPVNTAWVASQCGAHVLGELPRARAPDGTPCPPASPGEAQ